MHKNSKQRPSISHWGDNSDSRAASATSRATHSVKYTTARMSLATAASRNYRDQADSGRIRLGSARRASEQVQTLLQAWMKYCSCAAVQINRSTRRAERSQGNRRLPGQNEAPTDPQQTATRAGTSLRSRKEGLRRRNARVAFQADFSRHVTC